MIPRITFGIIVLNGEPFTRYCLRALYPFAHQIIVVEGACPAAAAVSTPDGHSLDGTLETLYRFQAEEDPDDKVTIVTREGFWEEKDAMSRAYAEWATGDYLWQVDIDEFYQPADMAAIIRLLEDDAAISALSFHQWAFWGGFDYLADGWYLHRGGNIFHRLFKWGPGYRYVTHRPPTVADADGRDLREVKYVDGHLLARQGIHLYHYALVLPKQVREKCAYYGAATWAERPGAVAWAEETFLGLRHPFRVHNVYQLPGWLERFPGEHPPQARALRADLEAGVFPEIDLRPTDDIERLLRSPLYALGRWALRELIPLDQRLAASYRWNNFVEDPRWLLRAVTKKLTGR